MAVKKAKKQGLDPEDEQMETASSDDLAFEAFQIKAYLALEAFLFFAIKLGELFLSQQPTKCIMFSAILANTVMTAWLYRRWGRRTQNRWHHLIALALGVNCLADVCLTLIGGERMFVPGFALFCMVEGIYAVYLCPGRRNIAVRGVFLLLTPVLAWKLNLLTAANILSGWNLTLLAGNVIHAWVAHKQERSRPSLLMAVGLTLFLCGDTSVAASLFATPDTVLYTASSLLVWTFYVPAEVLLVLTYCSRVKTGEGTLLRKEKTSR